MKSGYILEFKRGGPVSAILGGLLKLFERDWDGWGWHLAIAWDKADYGWYILEATAQGVETNYYHDEYLKENTRNYQWLERQPSKRKRGKFLKEHIYKHYDVAIYPWTMLQYLIRHFWNRRIPRLLDDRFTCWELVFEFCEEMGKPLASKYDCPIITDFLKAVKVKG